MTYHLNNGEKKLKRKLINPVKKRIADFFTKWIKDKNMEERPEFLVTKSEILKYQEMKKVINTI